MNPLVEKEQEFFSRLFDVLIGLRGRMSNFPNQRYCDSSESDEHITKTGDLLRQLRDVVSSYQPFYPSSLHSPLNQLCDLTNEWIASYHYVVSEWENPWSDKPPDDNAVCKPDRLSKEILAKTEELIDASRAIIQPGFSQS